jgi:RHS repeat-associated protein
VLGVLVLEVLAQRRQKLHGGPRRPDDEVRISYDAAGNRASLHRGGAETHYRHDAADQLLAAETGNRRTEYHYDPSGRLIEEIEAGRRRAIRYEGLGRPVEVTRTSPDGDEHIRTAFTGDNLPASVVFTNHDRRDEEHAASVHYRWSASDDLPQILSQQAEPNLDDAEHDLAGRLTADFSYGYERTFADWADGGRAFHLDWFGSALRTEETAAWALADRYSAFGEPEGAQRSDRGAPELPRFGFQGELALRDMIFLRARSYDTSLGRFTTRDPAALMPTQPVNPYAYAGNDPVNVTDPTGACFLPVGCGVLHHVVSGAEHLGGDVIHGAEHLGHDVVSGAERLGGDLRTDFDIARHDAAHLADVVIHEIATHPLLDVIVGTIAAVAAALLAPEVILAALAILETIAEIALAVLEVIEVALAILALLRLIHVLGPVATGRKPSEDAYVVRGGVTTPKQLQAGTAEHRGVPGLTGFSVQSAPGMTIEQLAAAGQFPNSQISVTTVSQLDAIGVRVVPSPGRGFHNTAVVPLPLPDKLAAEISAVFRQQRNPAPVKRG